MAAQEYESGAIVITAKANADIGKLDAAIIAKGWRIKLYNPGRRLYHVGLPDGASEDGCMTEALQIPGVASTKRSAVLGAPDVRQETITRDRMFIILVDSTHGESVSGLATAEGWTVVQHRGKEAILDVEVPQGQAEACAEKAKTFAGVEDAEPARDKRTQARH